MNGRPFHLLSIYSGGASVSSDYQPITFVVSLSNHERAALRQAQGERQKRYREITERPWVASIIIPGIHDPAYRLSSPGSRFRLSTSPAGTKWSTYGIAAWRPRASGSKSSVPASGFSHTSPRTPQPHPRQPPAPAVPGPPSPSRHSIETPS